MRQAVPRAFYHMINDVVNLSHSKNCVSVQSNLLLKAQDNKVGLFCTLSLKNTRHGFQNQRAWVLRVLFLQPFSFVCGITLNVFFAVVLICNVGKGPQYECKSKSVDVTPMPPYISNDLKGRIPALHHEQGYSVKKICQLLNIKKTLVYETLKHHRTFSVPYDPNARR